MGEITVRSGRNRSVRSRTILVGCLAAVTAMVAACAPSPDLVPFPEPDGSQVHAEAPDTVGPLRMVGGDLVDGEGRVVLIHGINSVRKDAPYISTTDPGWLGPMELAYILNSGFNGIRLGVSYAALMPEPGVVDETYLDQVVDTVDLLSDQGLWIQLDFHQDLFHMMPDWAMPPDAAGLSVDIPPLVEFIGWAGAYMSDRSMRQWNSFVKGEPIIDGRSVASVLGDAAAALAARVADRDRVIGIELLNEPFPGDPIVTCILEGCHGRDRMLSDRYSEMATPIRAVAPDMPIWIEPFAPTGYAAAPAMKPLDIPETSQGPQVGLAWHLYCKDTDGGEPVPAEPIWVELCSNRMKAGFDAARSQAKRLGGPSGVAVPRILNEFGASWNPLDVSLLMPITDKNFTSWMFWHMYSATTPYSTVVPDVVESQIIRPYPQATAGTPGELRYDPATGGFSYTFTPDRSITAPTSIVVPARAYPNGYASTVEGGSVVSANDSGMLQVVPGPTSTTVTVRLSRL